MPQEQPTTEPPPTGDTPPAALSPAIVHADLPCRDCGYNLRTLAHDHGCPECGLSVQWSAQGYQLKYARLSWLRQLQWGCDLMHLQIGFVVVAVPTFILAFSQKPVHWPSFYFGLVVLFLGILSGLVGGWLLTAAEYPRQRINAGRRHSRMVRLLLPFVAGGCAVGLLQMAGLTPLPAILDDWVATESFYFFILFVLVVQMLMLLLHLNELAGRASTPAVRRVFTGPLYCLVMVVLAVPVGFACAMMVEWAPLLVIPLFVGLLLMCLGFHIVAFIELRFELTNAITFGADARRQASAQ